MMERSVNWFVDQTRFDHVVNGDAGGRLVQVLWSVDTGLKKRIWDVSVTNIADKLKQKSIARNDYIETKLWINVMKKNLRVDSSDWKEMIAEGWIRVKFNWSDIWELQEWVNKWEQLFTQVAAKREAANQWLKILTQDQLEQLSWCVPWTNRNEQYSKFQKEFDIKKCWFRDPHGVFVFVWKCGGYWTWEDKVSRFCSFLNLYKIQIFF